MVADWVDAKIEIVGGQQESKLRGTGVTGSAGSNTLQTWCTLANSIISCLPVSGDCLGAGDELHAGLTIPARQMQDQLKW